MALKLTPVDSYSATQTYRVKGENQRKFRSIKIEDGKFIELRDDGGPIVWQLPLNFCFCRVEDVPDEEDVETVETVENGDSTETPVSEPNQ